MPAATENPIHFEVEGSRLYGVLHATREPADLAVLFLGGWSGDRLGPHRMFVTAARQLSERGIPSLRFDYRGRGDSEGTTKQATIDSMARDARKAAEELRALTGVEAIIPIGMCSGGKVAVELATTHTAVQRVALWSGEAMGHLAEASTQARKRTDALRQYARKSLDPATWRKLFRGNVNFQQVSRAVSLSEHAGNDERRRETAILERFRERPCPLFLVYGGNDPATAASAAAYRRFCDANDIPATFHEIVDANHSFYGLKWEADVLDLTASWITSGV